MQFDLPAVYDRDIYSQLHADLRNAGFDEQAMELHYRTFGAKEGRRSSSINTRKDFLNLIPEKASVLEIMPGYSPVTSGENVKFFDLQTRDELVSDAHELYVQTPTIPEIDYVSADGNLGIVSEKFEVVVSCHNIGRQPNLIRHLQQIEALLVSDGHLFCIVPDKRYTYDYFNPETTITSVLARHISDNSATNSEDLLMATIMRTHSDSLRHWKDNHGNQYLEFERRFSELSGKYGIGGILASDRNLQKTIFSPESFCNIIQLLNELKQTQMNVVRMYPTLFGRAEFFVILQKV
ncbi:MAG: hypothetical protein K9G49_09705 [Taibaiella sp.]|nr:hypothetical protein [Taibaiella sp.]